MWGTNSEKECSALHRKMEISIREVKWRRTGKGLRAWLIKQREEIEQESHFLQSHKMMEIELSLQMLINRAQYLSALEFKTVGSLCNKQHEFHTPWLVLKEFLVAASGITLSQTAVIIIFEKMSFRVKACYSLFKLSSICIYVNP